MEKEALPVIGQMTDTRDSVICGKRITAGNLFGQPAVIVVCGVGKVNAAIGAQIAIDRLGADVIVNIGVAGGLDPSLEIGSIYGISAVVQYDFDLTQLNGTQIGTLDECRENYLALAQTQTFKRKKLATGDRFNDSKADYNLLTDILSADIRDMECGAIAQVCMHANLPCYSFKIISDVAGSGSTTEQYLKNLNVCFETLIRELKNICEAING